VRFLYQAYYCEENIWQLCQHPDLLRTETEVIFISSHAAAFPIGHQRLAPPNDLVYWDYHVICASRRQAEGPWLIYDLDSRLCPDQAPCTAQQYLTRSFHGSDDLPDEYRPSFRVISGHTYTQTLVSDRAHMRNEQGDFHQPPPPWPPIGIEAGEESNNLKQFLCENELFVGQVLSLSDLLNRYQ